MAEEYIGSQEHLDDEVNAYYDQKEQMERDMQKQYEKEMYAQMEKDHYTEMEEYLKQSVTEGELLATHVQAAACYDPEVFNHKNLDMLLRLRKAVATKILTGGVKDMAEMRNLFEYITYQIKSLLAI
jgi:acyl-CoA reductase-like NAD-dependent aldehyde dehydrogenase